MAAAQGGAASSDTKTRLLERPREYVVNFELPDPDDTLEPPVISVLNVGFHYPNGPILFKDVDFGIDMDTRIAIVGPNGVGKSTLVMRFGNHALRPYLQLPFPDGACSWVSASGHVSTHVSGHRRTFSHNPTHGYA